MEIFVFFKVASTNHVPQDFVNTIFQTSLKDTFKIITTSLALISIDVPLFFMVAFTSVSYIILAVKLKHQNIDLEHEVEKARSGGSNS